MDLNKEKELEALILKGKLRKPEKISNTKERLETFENYPLKIDANRVAKAGYYFTHFKTWTQCYGCNKVIPQWLSIVRPTSFKYHHNGCRYARQRDPKDKKEQVEKASRETSEILYEQIKQKLNWQKLYPCEGAVHTSMRKLEKRKNSFSDPQWGGSTSNVTKDQLAQAGFFQDRDRKARCFYCSLAIANIGKITDLWALHAREGSRCEYLIQQQGLQFINNIIYDIES